MGRWFSRLFERGHQPLARPPLTERWRPGDLAECIRADWIATARQPALGSRAIVVAVRPGHAQFRKLGWGLQLVGYPKLWDATAFRKVTAPDLLLERRATKPEGVET